MRDFETALTVERLRQMIHYDPATGELRRLQNRGAAKAGSVVTYTARSGYVAVRIDGFLYFGHRLAWFYVHGRWPAEEIDHVDRCPTNNALANLREATSAQNKRNHRLQINNKSGAPGVSWCRRTLRWQASIHHERRNIFLGRYARFEDAVAARLEAEREHFGDFARVA